MIVNSKGRNKGKRKQSKKIYVPDRPIYLDIDQFTKLCEKHNLKITNIHNDDKSTIECIRIINEKAGEHWLVEKNYNRFILKHENNEAKTKHHTQNTFITPYDVIKEITVHGNHVLSKRGMCKFDRAFNEAKEKDKQTKLSKKEQYRIQQKMKREQNKQQQNNCNNNIDSNKNNENNLKIVV